MAAVRPIIPLLVLLSLALLFCLPNPPAISGFGGVDLPLGAPLIQKTPHLPRPADLARSLQVSVLLELLAALAIWGAARSAHINHQRRTYAALDLPTPREFVLVCMHDRDGKKR